MTLAERLQIILEEARGVNDLKVQIAELQVEADKKDAELKAKKEEIEGLVADVKTIQEALDKFNSEKKTAETMLDMKEKKLAEIEGLVKEIEDALLVKEEVPAEPEQPVE